MIKLDDQIFKKMANKIYIDLDQKALLLLKKEYEEIERLLKILNNINTDNVEPLVRISSPIIFLRDDQEDKTQYLPKNVILDNASEKNDDYIIIKRILK